MTWAALAALIVLCISIYTPDSNPDQMLADYGGPTGAYIDAGDYRIFTREYGDPDGPPLILIHGSNGNALTWEPMIEHLSGYRIITYDQPGHGLTGPHPMRDYSFDAMANGLESVRKAFDLAEFAVAGSSMGGRTAWTYARRNPDRVSALILISASGLPRREGDAERPKSLVTRLIETPVLNKLMTVVTPRTLVDDSLRGMVADNRYVTDDLVDQYWRMIRMPGNRQATIDRRLTTRDYAGEAIALDGLSTPTLVIWGNQDRVVPPSNALRFAELLPNAEVTIWDDIGHLPMEEAPKRTADLIAEFLTRDK
ncbi:MAG: alpha/beta hydrolase [Pseudomonadota bacterium]